MATHPRRITTAVFSDGTTISGARLDAALEEAIGRFNNIQPGDLKRRWVYDRKVGGHTPALDNNAGRPNHRWPWMRHSNAITGETPTNLVRVKGTRMPGVTILTGTTANQYVWTSHYYFSAPTTITSFVLEVIRDGVAGGEFVSSPNDWLYGAVPPDGFSASDNSQDLAIVIDSASPFRIEDTALSDVVAIKADFVVNYHRWCDPGGLSTANPGFVLPTPNGGAGDIPWGDPHGVAIRMEPMNLQIPAGSRVRVSVVIPLYVTLTNQSWGTAGRPWEFGPFRSTLTYKREVTRGG